MLKLIRDVLMSIAAVAVVVFVIDHFAMGPARAESYRQGRLQSVDQQIEALTKAYTANVFNNDDVKGIYQQIFRQNEIILEYQKLLIRAAVANSPTNSTWP